MDVEFIKEIYNSCYAASDKNINDRALNKVCWNSAFNSRPYADEEMREWRDNTVEIIRESAPKKILEVACGTGMLLFSLIGGCNEYTGVDIAKEGIGYISSRLSDDEKKKVTLYVMEAKDIDTLPGQDYDIAFINSATQYMGPDSTLEDYIGKMIDHVRKDGIIFLGDNKSLSYREHFYRCAEDFDSPQTVAESRTERKNKFDFEHYIGADFVKGLEEKFPRVKKAEIRAKKGKYVTEMNLFRFDIVLYLDSYDEKEYTVINEPINGINELESAVKKCSADRICLEHLKNKLFYENVSVKFGENEQCTASFYISDICGLFEALGYHCRAVPCRNEIDGYFNIYADKN